MGIFETNNQFESAVISADGGNLDLAGRFRTSEKETLFTNYKASMKNHTMIEKITGSATATLDYNASLVDLTTTTASGDKITRQSFYYMPYLPGTPILMKATATFATSKANCKQRVGMFDDNNGLLFEDNGTGMTIVNRSKATGSIINTVFAQADWNIDKLDGKGPSRLTRTNWNEALLFYIEYLWQGVVGARFGLLFGQQFVPLHEIIPSVNLPVSQIPFIGKPNLPARYEIENTGVTASPTTFKEICVDVVAEGGHRLVGSDWAITTDGTTVSVGVTRVPVLVLRLKDSFNGEACRRTLKALNTGAWSESQDVNIAVAVVHNPTSVSGGTAWADVDAGHSQAEFKIASTAITITGGDVHYLDHFTATAKAGGAGFSGFADSASRFDDTHSLVTQNIDGDNSDLFVVYARARASTTNIVADIKFLEYE